MKTNRIKSLWDDPDEPEVTEPDESPEPSDGDDENEGEDTEG